MTEGSVKLKQIFQIENVKYECQQEQIKKIERYDDEGRKENDIEADKNG